MAARLFKKQLVRSVRLDDQSVTKILDALDASCTPGARERRQHARYRYRARACVVHLQQPQDAAPVAYLTPTRDLSSSGLSFIHGHYVHIGTPCLAELLTKDGQVRRVLGKVVRCRLISGTLHEVGVRFIEDLPVGDFANAGRHTLLLAADDARTPRPLRLTLEQLGCDVQFVESADAVLTAVGQDAPEMIMLDADAPAVAAEQTASRLRSAGYAGLLAIYGKDLKTPDRKNLLATGADRCLNNPPSRTAIYALLLALRHAPIHARQVASTPTTDAVTAFLDELVVRLHDAESALSSGLWEGLDTCAADITARGMIFGYPCLTELGRQLEVALSDANTRRNIGPILATLWDRCLRARLGFRASLVVKA